MISGMAIKSISDPPLSMEKHIDLVGMIGRWRDGDSLGFGFSRGGSWSCVYMGVGNFIRLGMIFSRGLRDVKTGRVKILI